MCIGECLWAGPTIPGEAKLNLQREKGMTEDEMVGRHHQLDEHEFK